MNSRVLVGISAAVMAAGLALGACSDDGGSGDDSSATTDDTGGGSESQSGLLRADQACATLTEADIVAVYGPVGPPTPVDPGTCQWAFGTFGEPGAAILLVSLAAPTPDAEEQFAELRATEGGEDVPGLGDEAIYTSAAILYVRTGDQTFTVQYFPLGGTAPSDPANPQPTPVEIPDQRAQLTQLAQTILVNLQNAS